MRRVIVDVDGTLWDLHTPLNKLLSELYPGFPTGIPETWNYFEPYVSIDQFFAAVKTVHNSQLNYSPFIGASYLFQTLSQLDLEIIVASHREPNTAHLLAQWLNKHELFPYSTLYTGNNKLPFIQKGDIVIDDAPKTIAHSLEIGALSYYLDWPFNRQEEGSWHPNLFALAVNLAEDIK